MTDPKASGYENAKSLIREVVIEGYAYKDLLLFLPDADGKDRSQEFASFLSRVHLSVAKTL